MTVIPPTNNSSGPPSFKKSLIVYPAVSATIKFVWYEYGDKKEQLPAMLSTPKICSGRYKLFAAKKKKIHVEQETTK
jgi:hypothetical protein